jgi:hypothetical protein
MINAYVLSWVLSVGHQGSFSVPGMAMYKQHLSLKGFGFLLEGFIIQWGFERYLRTYPVPLTHFQM